VTSDQARGQIQEQFGVPAEGDGRALAVTVPIDRWLELGRFARGTLGCVYFNFSTAVDWKDQGLDVVARVENIEAGFSLTMKTRLAAGETRCPSLVPVWRGAGWMEREAYDMFGVEFDGHPDLRRILLPQDWEGHPLLKSYAVDTPHPPYR
jgi:NADH-quinone oxidoreductase subunit C